MECMHTPTCQEQHLKSISHVQGPLATNEKLRNATKLFEGQIHGSGMRLSLL